MLLARNRSLFEKLWLVALSLALANSQLLEYYASQSPFSADSINPSISRAIKTNKLKPSVDYWQSPQAARSTYVTNHQARNTQSSTSNRRPKHYSSTAKAPPAPYVIENYNSHRLKPSSKPYQSYDGHYNVDYDLQAVSKSKYETPYKEEMNYQTLYNPYEVSRSKLKPASQDWNKAPVRYTASDYLSPTRYPTSDYDDGSYNETRSYCNPDAPPACLDYRFGMCVEDNSYPEDDIRIALEHFMVRNHLPNPLAVLNDEPTTPTPAHLLIPDEPVPGVCPSSSARVTPIRVKNTDGRWRVIVQRYGEVVQRENVVVCERRSLYGAEEVACSKDGRHEIRLQESPLARSCFRYYCNQLKAVKRYLAFDPCNPAKGLFVDSFPMPSACSCRLNRVIC